MRKTMIVLAVLCLGFAGTAPEAQARGRNGALAAGLVGGLAAGVLAGAAIAGAQPAAPRVGYGYAPVYGPPRPVHVYHHRIITHEYADPFDDDDDDDPWLD